jgi:hypothetical protein
MLYQIIRYSVNKVAYNEGLIGRSVGFVISKGDCIPQITFFFLLEKVELSDVIETCELYGIIKSCKHYIILLADSNHLCIEL